VISHPVRVRTAAEGAPAWVSYAALGVSALALVFTTGLGIFTWRRSGALLSVVGDLRAPLFQGWGRRRPARAGEPLILTITVRNRGRTPVKVHRVFLGSRKGGRSGFGFEEQSDELPVTVQGRDRARWYVSRRQLGVLAKHHGNPLVVRPLIEWGPGYFKRGRRLWIRIADEDLPGAAPRFKSTLGYRLRAFRGTKGVGPIEGTAMPLTVSMRAAADDAEGENTESEQ
jgi:hypothetical protein